MSAPRLWIDLDNSPHVPLFAPLIRHLRAEGWPLIVTARDFAQTLDLVEQLGVDAVAVGRHAGRSKVRKIANLPVRAGQLIRAVRAFRPELALSHGSRTQVIAARLLGVPSIVMFDYEWTEMSIFGRLADRLLCPTAIDAARLQLAGIPPGKVEHYDGFKEDLYLPEFRADPGFRDALGVGQDAILVTVRPPGVIGNYHDPRSEHICRELIGRASARADVVMVVLPKTRVERELVQTWLPERPAATIFVPDRAIPGLQLLAASDVAVSGGGTMNREAALLGVPTWSMFTGRRAAVDEKLAEMGLLRFLDGIGDLDGVQLQRSERPAWQAPAPRLIYDLEARLRKFPAPDSLSGTRFSHEEADPTHRAPQAGPRVQ